MEFFEEADKVILGYNAKLPALFRATHGARHGGWCSVQHPVALSVGWSTICFYRGVQSLSDLLRKSPPARPAVFRGEGNARHAAIGGDHLPLAGGS